METAKTLEDFIVMVGLSAQDEPTIHAVCLRDHMWRWVPVIWTKSGTERIEVYELSLSAKVRTIVVGEK